MAYTYKLNTRNYWI